MDGNCSFIFSSEKLKLKNVYFEYDVFDSYGNYKEFKIAKILTSPIPTFSNACKSGLYEDSWANSANTEAAKNFITSLGFNLDEIRNGTGLYIKSTGPDSYNGYKLFYNFGFIVH